MKILWCLWFLGLGGCAGFDSWAKDPANQAWLSTLAQVAAEEGAGRVAKRFDIKDPEVTQQLADEARRAARTATDIAVSRLGQENEQWRSKAAETIRASIAGISKAIGAAGASTGNPMLIGLGGLVGAAALLFRKKEEKP